MHDPYVFSADDLGDSLEFGGKPSILEADDYLSMTMEVSK